MERAAEEDEKCSFGCQRIFSMMFSVCDLGPDGPDPGRGGPHGTSGFLRATGYGRGNMRGNQQAGSRPSRPPLRPYRDRIVIE